MSPPTTFLAAATNCCNYHRCLGGDETNLHELLAFLGSDASSVAVVAEDLEARGPSGFFDEERGAPARLSDALAKWVRGEMLPEAWTAHRHAFEEVTRLASRRRGHSPHSRAAAGVGASSHAECEWTRLIVAPAQETSPGEAPELGWTQGAKKWALTREAWWLGGLLLRHVGWPRYMAAVRGALALLAAALPRPEP